MDAVLRIDADEIKIDHTSDSAIQRILKLNKLWARKMRVKALFFVDLVDVKLKKPK